MMNGPVVAAAQAALRAGDVTPALKWVHVEHEPEVRRAFARTLKVRAAGPEASELADTYFFETLVRLHRAGEGAPYTGIKPSDTEVEPAVEAADAALAKDSVEELARTVANDAARGVRERFERTRDTRRVAGDSIASGREYVAAYIEFIHYVEQLHAAARGHGDTGR
jgi:hypothetical protein